MNSQKRGYHYPIGQLEINKQHIWMKQIHYLPHNKASCQSTKLP